MTYKDKKEKARQEIIEAHYDFWSESVHFWSEVVDFENKCYNVGKRYGLLKEFRENAII